MEYSALLYKNPRGIGCNKCHGEKGKGRLIAKYKVRKRVKKGDEIYTVTIPKELKAPAINKLTYEVFYNALQKNITGMPRYYLTKGEIKALYFYLQQVNLEEEK